MLGLRGFCVSAVVVCMFCGVSSGITLESISIDTYRGWDNNVEESNPYELKIDVETTDASIKAINVLTPAGSGVSTFSLTPIDDNSWKYNSPDDYVTLAELRAQYKTGTWTFQFLGDGDVVLDSATLTYDPIVPTGFPAITYPAGGAADVPLSLTFTWDASVATGDGLIMYVETQEDSMEVDGTLMNLAGSQWTPVGPLEPSTDYRFGISVATAADLEVEDGVPQAPIFTTANGVNFGYFAVFENGNTVDFTTVPEPGSAILLLCGSAALLRRYSSRLNKDSRLCRVPTGR